jgi:hypothetical protein
MPSTPLTAASIGSVIWDSTTSAEAPRYEVDTEMFGGSSDGNSRTPRKEKPSRPKSTIVIDMTIARTGRRILRV